jgi:hypothetical protein
MNLDQKAKNRIRTAIVDGNSKYWRDGRQQEKYLKKWRDNNCEGECQSVEKPGDGTIIAYIYEEVMKELEAI